MLFSFVFLQFLELDWKHIRIVAGAKFLFHLSPLVVASEESTQSLASWKMYINQILRILHANAV